MFAVAASSGPANKLEGVARTATLVFLFLAVVRVVCVGPLRARACVRGAAAHARDHARARRPFVISKLRQ